MRRACGGSRTRHASPHMFNLPIRRALGALSLAVGSAIAGRAGAQPTNGAPARPAADPTTRRPVAAPPLVGVVRDSAGAPLADVQVVVAGINRLQTTDANGRFEFRGLTPGRYHLDAILLGYARADADAVIRRERLRRAGHDHDASHGPPPDERRRDRHAARLRSAAHHPEHARSVGQGAQSQPRGQRRADAQQRARACRSASTGRRPRPR